MDKVTMDKVTMSNKELDSRVSYLENEVKRLNENMSVLLSAFNGKEETEKKNYYKRRNIPPPPSRALPYPLSSGNDID